MKKISKELVSVIITNYNGKHHLERCLGSLNRQTYRKTEILLVDNASQDGSVSFVRQQFKDIKIIELKENRGFAEGNNIGFRQASGNYVFFLNNDTEAASTCIERLVDVLEKDRTIGGVQAKLLLMDEPKRLDSIGAYFTNTGFLFHNHFLDADDPELDQVVELYTLKGAAMMFPRRVLTEVSLMGKPFDPNYFAYFEETDLCHRIWLAGYRIVYEPSGVVLHKLGSTSKTLDQGLIQYHSFKNRIATYIKNLGGRKLIVILPLHIVVCIGIAGTSLLKGNIALSWAILRAIGWNIHNITDVLNTRSYIQKNIRKVPDEFFWQRIFRSVPPGYYQRIAQRMM